METKPENTYSNIIAPSDGVRRFLCKTSVLVLGIAAVIYSVFAFRMNAFEYDYAGGSLRSSMLYAAYVMFPLGVLTSAIFARIKKCGLAFSMISLLVAAAGLFMLFLNSISAMLKELGVQAMFGSLVEVLMFIAAMALFINLIMSCMNFRILHIFGLIGMVFAVLALIVTGARIATSYSAMQFAWNSDFDWNNLALQVGNDNLESQARWIFRAVSLSAPEAKTMFMLRFYERIAACVFYAAFALFFMKYKNEMVNFNKLIEHAREYVDIPQAHIAESIAETEKLIQEKLKASTNSVRERLKNITKKEVDSDEYDPLNGVGMGEAGVNGDDWRRRPDDEYGEERLRMRRRPDDEYGEERPRMRRRPDDEYGEERPRPRRRPDDEYGEERPRPRRRPDDEYGEERPRPRRRPDDEYGEERPRPRRRPDDEYGEERPRPRRRLSEEEMRERERRRRREEDMTAEERYLMEKRRRRNPDYDDEIDRRRRRQAAREEGMDADRENRRKRQARRIREEGGTQSNLNEYYSNYLRSRSQNDDENRRGNM